MIDCPRAEVRDLLPDLANESLTPDRRAAVESHLATCPACRAELAVIRSVRGALAASPPMDLDRIVAALPRPTVAPAAARGRGRGGGDRRRRFTSWQLAAAVSLFAVGGASLAVAIRDPGPASWIDSTANGRPAVAPIAELATLTLGDRLSELSDDDLEDLLTVLDGFAALPPEEPAPVIHPLDTDGDAR